MRNCTVPPKGTEEFASNRKDNDDLEDLLAEALQPLAQIGAPKGPSQKEKGKAPEKPRDPPRIAPSANPGDPFPSIELLHMKDYSNVSKIAECNHLDDDNWHVWKECMKH